MTTPIKYEPLRVVIVALVAHLYLLLFVPCSMADVTGEELLEAARTAIQSGDRTGFATVLEGAAVATLGFVNVKIAVLRREIAQNLADGTISAEQAGTRLETLSDLQSRLAEKKSAALGGHRDQGKKPFSGLFTPSVPLGPSLPTEVTLTLSQGSEFIVKPDIWSGGIVSPAVTNTQLTVRTDQGALKLTGLTFGAGSFDIVGAPSGPNVASLRPGTTGQGEVNSTTGEFQARYEGSLVNTLYPSGRPIVFFGEATGFISPDRSQVLLSTTEPMIVPGGPGQPPIDRLGMAYIATRATFDPASRALFFTDNVDPSLSPDVSIVRTPEGNYIADRLAGEPLVGARFLIDPLSFLGRDSTGRFLFADSHFSIFDSDGTFAAGQLTGIGIDPSSYLFTAGVVFDELSDALPSSFISNWRAAPFLQLLGPEATLDLVSATEGFLLAGSSPIDFINASPIVPEPSMLLLLGSSLIGLAGIAWRRRHRSIESPADGVTQGRRVTFSALVRIPKGFPEHSSTARR